MSAKTIRVLVVDDSALVRGILEKGLSQDPHIEVVGTASDPFVARDKIVELKPDVLTLDVEMPRMDGVEFLRRLMPQFPLPVVMVSSLTERGKTIALQALEAGAVDIVTKPKTDMQRGLSDMLAESTDKVIAIGASTGGTEALKAVISKLPANTPGVVVVQHMPPGFTKMFADRLNTLTAMEVKEAEHGDRVRQGRVLIAPGDFQMTVKRSGGIYEVECRPGEKVCGHCPSVEVLFQSVARSVASNAVGLMLTGMGSDGSDGMLAMRKAGARTMAQDEASCVVFGMPKVAYEKGGAERLVALERIADELLAIVGR